MSKQTRTITDSTYRNIGADAHCVGRVDATVSTGGGQREQRTVHLRIVDREGVVVELWNRQVHDLHELLREALG